MNILRKLLLVIIWLSLLTIPFSFLAYFCYIGLCGGAEAREIGRQYADYYGTFIWLYPLIVFPSLFISWIFKKFNKMRFSFYVLFIPLLLLGSFVYVEWDVWRISQVYEKQRIDAITPHKEDYVCEQGKFVRLSPAGFYFYNYRNVHEGSMGFYNNSTDLIKALKEVGLEPKDCRNETGNFLTERIP